VVQKDRGRKVKKRKKSVYNAFRRHDGRRPIVPADDPLAVAESVQAAKAYPEIPFPIGVPYPRPKASSKCGADHPLWKDHAKRTARIEKFVAEYADNPLFSEDEINAIRVREYKKDRQYKRKREATIDCVRGYEYTQANRARKATESSTREAARRRQEMLAMGVDPGSAEYLDTLSPSGKAKALRRMGRINEAREVERRQRADRGQRRRAA
jgi:hypothetical protein